MVTRRTRSAVRLRPALLAAVLGLLAIADVRALAQAPGAPSSVSVNAKPAQPTIKTLSTPSGSVGETVTISGSGFGAVQGLGSVTFNGVTATPSAWSALSISVTVPVGATTGNVVVSQSSLSSSGVSFTVTAAVAAACDGFSTVRYMNANLATGSNNGGVSNAWQNAWRHQDDMIAGLTRPAGGLCVYIADGAKSGGAVFATFTTASSGSTPIKFVKATAADHGSDVGWSPDMGNGTYTWGEICAPTSNYWYFDGATRNASNWFDSSGANYGFRFNAITGNGGGCPLAADNVTFRRIDIGNGESPTWAGECDPNSCWGVSVQNADNWTFTESRFHNHTYTFQTTNVTNFVVEYSVGGPTWAKEFWRGYSGTINSIFRYNHLIDTCQGIPGQPGDGITGCTSMIAIFDSGNFNGASYGGHQIYGNLFGRSGNAYSLTHGHESNGCISFLATQNTQIYGNLCYGLETNAAIDFGSGTCTSNCGGNVARNNMWFGLRSATSSGVVGGTASNNAIQATNIFVDPTTTGPSDPPNFRLTGPSTTSGFSLSAPFNVDLSGVTRGCDGTWDIGAFEFVMGGC